MIADVNQSVGVHVLFYFNRTIHPKGKQADFCTSEVQKYEKVQRSTEKYQEVRRSTEVRFILLVINSIFSIFISKFIHDFAC